MNYDIQSLSDLNGREKTCENYVRYEICMNFLNGLLKDEKLTEAEFERTAKYVAKRWPSTP